MKSKKPLLIIFLFLPFLHGCPVEGDNGNAGLPGINCWDTNGNRVNDQSEDVNFDGAWSAADCAGAGQVSQSKEAELNHQHICEALASLGQYPTGCPSSTATPPSGTLTFISQDLIFDDGVKGYTTCNNAPNDGNLKVVYKPDTKNSWFTLEQAFIAQQTVVSLNDEVQTRVCSTQCSNDPKCIASWARRYTTESFECYIFYHSDTVSDYEHICGVDVPGVYEASEVCKLGMALENRWSAICP